MYWNVVKCNQAEGLEICCRLPQARKPVAALQSFKAAHCRSTNTHYRFAAADCHIDNSHPIHCRTLHQIHLSSPRNSLALRSLYILSWLLNDKLGGKVGRESNFLYLGKLPQAAKPRQLPVASPHRVAIQTRPCYNAAHGSRVCTFDRPGRDDLRRFGC